MKSRLRLLYYNHTAEVSGAEISLLTALVQLRRQAEVALAAPEGELLTRAWALDIPVYVLPGYSAHMTTHPLRLLTGVWEMYRCSRHLKALLRAIRPDILHANSIRAGLIAAAAVRAQSVGVVWHVRDNLASNLVGRVIRHIAQARADTVVAISEAVAAHFATRPRLRQKTRVVYNGVDVDPLACASSLRAELG
ncbi:MAG: glycosyltransferase, partial [Alicyclobacillus herbarius]|uniref:glycosyltransferase n=1 Tax=Alicyclobacillus herbarius TaxID=122960 RepID=UPI0023563123